MPNEGVSGSLGHRILDPRARLVPAGEYAGARGAGADRWTQGWGRLMRRAHRAVARAGSQARGGITGRPQRDRACWSANEGQVWERCGTGLSGRAGSVCRRSKEGEKGRRWEADGWALGVRFVVFLSRVHGARAVVGTGGFARGGGAMAVGQRTPTRWPSAVAGLHVGYSTEKREHGREKKKFGR
jgi:hypothetical protein